MIVDNSSWCSVLLHFYLYILILITYLHFYFLFVFYYILVLILLYIVYLYILLYSLYLYLSYFNYILFILILIYTFYNLFYFYPFHTRKVVILKQKKSSSVICKMYSYTFMILYHSLFFILYLFSNTSRFSQLILQLIIFWQWRKLPIGESGCNSGQ